MSLAEKLAPKQRRNKKKDRPIKNIQAKVDLELAEAAEKILDQRGYTMVEFFEASMTELIEIDRGRK